MITIEPLPTPKQLFKNLYRLVRCNCSAYDLHLSLSHSPDYPKKAPYQQMVSDIIQEFTHEVIPSSYPSSFAKQLRVYMYSYRHHRLGGVSRG